MRQIVFVLLSVSFVVAAVFHLVAVFTPLNQSPVWRNLLFVGINLLFAFLMLKRPRWFIYLFAILLVQQLHGHGTELLDKWNMQHQIDWPSVGVLLVMPVAFVMLLTEKRNH